MPTTLYTRTLSGQTIVATPLPGPPGHFVVTDMDFAHYPTTTLRLHITGGQSTLDDDPPNHDGGGITAIVADPGQPQTGGVLTGVVATLKNLPAETNSSPGSGDGYGFQDFNVNGLGTPPTYIDFTGPGVAKSLYFWAPASTPHGDNITAYFKDYTILLESLAPPAPTATIDSPSAGAMDPTAPIVYDAVAPAGFVSTEATVTDFSGLPVLVYSTAGGFAPGYNGTVAAITNGFRVTINPPSGAWPSGPLSIHVEVDDSTPASATADRAWTVDTRDLSAQAAGRVIVQYRASTKLLAEIGAHAAIWQQIKDCLLVIPTLDDNTIATGVNLDVNGQIVGEDRNLSNGDIADDGEYLVMIQARITRNGAITTNPALEDMLANMFGVAVQLTDYGGMSVAYVIFREPTSDEIAVLDEDILARSMGVKVSRSWVPATGYFGFAENPNALGFADDSGGYPGTGGGELAVDF